jgi:putative nucleotidyltransferase with HDIG domain
VTKKPLGAVVMLVAAMCGITILLRLANDEPTIEIARQLYYLPIIYAGFNFTVYGAVIVSLCSAYLSATRGAQINFEYGSYLTAEDFAPILQLAMFFLVGYFASTVSAAIRRRAVEARMLYEVARSISSSLRLRQVLDLIATSAQTVMGARACGIRLLDNETGELRPVVMRGLSEEYLSKGSVSRESSPLDRRVLAGEAVQVLDVRHDPNFQYPEAAEVEGLRSVLSVPLRSKDEPLGVIRVYARGKRRFRGREEDLLMAFAHQAAVAIENAELYEDIRRNYYETVRALTTAIEARDPTTYNHSERVTELAERLAAALEMPPEERETLRFGCILHDIGKIGVEESALEAREPGDREQVFYRMHPLIGRSILQPIGFLSDALPIVIHHHEHWDGSGFPEGIGGEDIPYHARLCAIVDSYERLRNAQQPGVANMSLAEAVAEITAGAGTKFDPRLVAAFRKVMEVGPGPVAPGSPEEGDEKP